MITGVILAKNDERNISECVEALDPHVEEIILIDVDIAERTREVAGNIAIDDGQHDWRWSIDADEQISAEV